MQNESKIDLVESYGLSDMGLVRTNNEDVWMHLSKENLFLLADGMGGHQAGEIAASEIIARIAASATTFFSHSENHQMLSAAELQIHLKEWIIEANRHVYELSIQNEQFKGMGTTLCCALLWQDKAICAHVGDSRIYRLRQGKLDQLTKDHSLCDQLIARGKLDPLKKSFSPFKKVITRAIGTGAVVNPEIQIFSTEPEDLYFLCSDGLSDHVFHQEMSEAIYQANSIKNACEALVDLAKKDGGTDNITVLMFKLK